MEFTITKNHGDTTWSQTENVSLIWRIDDDDEDDGFTVTMPWLHTTKHFHGQAVDVRGSMEKLNRCIHWKWMEMLTVQFTPLHTGWKLTKVHQAARTNTIYLSGYMSRLSSVAWNISKLVQLCDTTQASVHAGSHQQNVSFHTLWQPGACLWAFYKATVWRAQSACPPEVDLWGAFMLIAFLENHSPK